MPKSSELLKKALEKFLNLRRWNQSDLARALKTGKAVVNRFFTLSRDHRISAIDDLSEILNVEPWELLYDYQKHGFGPQERIESLETALAASIQAHGETLKDRNKFEDQLATASEAMKAMAEKIKDLESKLREGFESKVLDMNYRSILAQSIATFDDADYSVLLDVVNIRRGDLKAIKKLEQDKAVLKPKITKSRA